MLPRNCGSISTIICSGIFLIISIVLLIIWPSLYISILKNELILTNKSKSYELWRETPIPMYLELYLYNFSNAEEVMNNPNNVIPSFVEMGPYVFREHHLKVNESWHENHTITFFQRRTWYYEENLSNGSLDDMITNINVVTATATHFVRDMSWAVRFALNLVLLIQEEGVLVTKTARELLFQGYTDPIINLANNISIPGLEIPYDKFGWFYDRNESDTYDGVMNMFTGADDTDKLGLVDLWNHKDRVDFYDGECGKVKGGTGELFPPFLDPENVTVFATDVCSAITLKKTGDITIHGITGLLYTGDESVFDDGKMHPEQACFCKGGQRCVHSGGRNVSECKLGAPAVVTFPHFYLADPYYASKVHGITPNKENDEFLMGLETYTGIPLSVRAQLQINIYIERIPGITVLNKLPNATYFPMLWFRQEVQLTEEYAKDARFALMIPDIIKIVSLCIIGLTILLSGISGFCIYRNRIRNVEAESLILPSEK